MEKLLIAALWVLTVIAAGFIGFMRAYLKKKGENLATHEDIAKLVEQVRAVTTATKEIEAKISTDVWDRQKRWEMKREVLFEATKRIGAVVDALMGLDSTHKAERINRKPGQPEWLEAKLQAGAKWLDETKKFDETCLLVSIVGGEEVKYAFDDFHAFTRGIALGIKSDDSEIYSKSVTELLTKSIAARTAIRKELETDKTT